VLDALETCFISAIRESAFCFSFFERRDFFAALFPLRFELLGRGDEFAALLVELAKSVQVQHGAAPLRHLGEVIQVDL